MNYFVLDDQINSRYNLGLRVTQPPTTVTSRRIVDRISVDGREGTLTLLKGWEDTSFSFRVALQGSDLRTQYREVVAQILEAKTIYFSNDSDVFYNIKTVDIGELDFKLICLAEFQLTFTCAPFKYQRNVEIITCITSDTISNPGTFYSLPKIKVYGKGKVTITINGNPIILNILSNYITIDSELKECSYGNVAQNQHMVGDFPVFKIGSNYISLGTDITRVEIDPRWRFI